MEQITYCVLLHRGEWQIECNGHHYGPHRTKDAAVKIALAAAKLAKRDGDAARVVVQERDQSWHTEWQHGFNQFPNAPVYAW